MKKYFTASLVLFLIAVNILFSARWVIGGNLYFHTDIARDFLLMEDIVNNKHLTLLGPRSGAIPGLFHGPLWLYLNLPFFWMGAGNPVVVAWFWVGLYVLSLIIIFYVGYKLIGKQEGLLAALLLSSATILYVRSLFNPYGALLLSPLYIFFLFRYLNGQNLLYLISAFFILGFIIQFQLAYGVPILLLTVIYLLFHLYKNKRIQHLFSLFILVFPLSSFLIFDLRNNFLQLRSVVSYVSGAQTHGKLEINLFQLIFVRAKEMLIEGLGAVSQNSFLSTILLLVFLFSFLLNLKRKSSQTLIFYLIGYFYLGFWFLSIFFKGPVWNYYYLPFIPLIILMYVSLRGKLNKFIFYPILALIYIFNLQPVIKDLNIYTNDPLKQDVSTWQFNKSIADKIYSEKEKDFGYFIFTPDLYGYSPRYALNYFQSKNLDSKTYPYQKRKVTYLVIAPPPEYGKDPNSIWYQKNTNSVLWKSNDIRLDKAPMSVTTFNNGFIIEKYNLSEEEQKIEPNPYLIKDIFFR